MSDIDDTTNPDDDHPGTGETRVEELEGQLIEAMERIKVLEDSLAESQKELKKALIGAKTSKPVKAVSGKNNLQKAISALLAGSLSKIDRLLIRAKNVSGGGFKIATDIKMIEGNAKAEGALADKLEGLIEGSKSEYITLSVCVAQVKGGEPRVAIDITEPAAN
jgi:hypothetical protein